LPFWTFGGFVKKPVTRPREHPPEKLFGYAASCTDIMTISVTRKVLGRAAVGMLIGLVVCTGSASSQTRELQPLVVGWERYFVLTWEPFESRGRPGVSGRVNNVSPHSVRNIQVLVESLDGGGQIVAQKIAWVPGDLGGGGSLYFEVPVTSSPSYRVRIFAYDRVESNGQNLR
jgi:hypothetical protein